METEIKVSTIRPSLLLLNEYCILEIFEFLDMDESINLAKTSNRLRFVADRIFKIHAKVVRVDGKMINKGEEYIDHFFQHIGRHVTSLDFHCRYTERQNVSKILGNISNKCKNLKDLKCSTFCSTICDRGVQPAYSFDNVELLTLDFCNDKVTDLFTKSFLESFHRLKYVNITFAYIGSDELKMIFQNNRSIESFYYNGNRQFNCQLLELIPNVERLSLAVTCPSAHILELNSLLKLNRLTKLRLDYGFKYAKKVVRELATKGLIKELELYDAEVDEDIFNTLASFSKLQLFVLHTRDNVELKSSVSWPAQLNKLRLVTFDLTKNHLIAMIQQLESIESIDIGLCRIVQDDIHNFNDVAKLAQDICNIIEHSNRKQRLDVVLPKSVKPEEPPKKYLVESERLRVLQYRCDVYNPLGINVNFPGL